MVSEAVLNAAPENELIRNTMKKSGFVAEQLQKSSVQRFGRK
ncbi:hypothetical protein [Agathobaculum sp.]